MWRKHIIHLSQVSVDCGHEVPMLYFIKRVVHGAAERSLPFMVPMVPTCPCRVHIVPTPSVIAPVIYVSTSIDSPVAGTSCTLTNLLISSFLMIFSFNTAVVPIGNR